MVPIKKFLVAKKVVPRAITIVSRTICIVRRIGVLPPKWIVFILKRNFIDIQEKQIFIEKAANLPFPS